MSAEGRPLRVPLLKALRDLAKSGATLDASIVTTYAFNGLFYEEVLLRAFERAGSRLNIVLADAGQLAESLADPLRRPQRAGVDYLLVPISHVGAFHPKIVALLSERQPILAVGSHNATDAGFSHNEEVTACWSAGKPAPPAVLTAAVEYALQWVERAGPAPASILADITGRIRSLLPASQPAANEDVSLIASSQQGRLWDQLRPKISGAVNRVIVVGPYFDNGMELFAAIERDLEPSEIIVAIQPTTAVMPRPDLAPSTARFVDAADLQAFWSEADKIGFAHGKVLAIEAEGGTVLSLGSANPSGAAWLDQPRWNAEANLCITGASAAAAFEALGLNRAVSAPSIATSRLKEIADRSQAARSQERAAVETPGPPLIAAQVAEAGIMLPSFSAPPNARLEWFTPGRGAQPISFAESVGGTLVSFVEPRPGAGLHELRAGGGTVAFVLISDAHALRAAALPRDGARILDHLGSLGSGAGVTDLLELLDKHVLSPADGPIGASRAVRPNGHADEAGDSAAPFGPRGVSLPPDAELGVRRPRLSDGLIADIIAALIRALGAPPPAPVATTDGDAPNLDEGDAEGGPSSDDIASNLEADAEAPEIDWPRLVTACRKRLSVMLKRLEARLEEAKDSDLPPGWSLGRLVVVLSLLHRLRCHPPQVRQALNGRAPPSSLVSLEQLNIAFHLAVRALYGPAKLALQLESALSTRATEERWLVDNLLFWLAREIGADCVRERREANNPWRLQARADLGPVAMSAAACESLEPWAAERDPWLAVWDDAVPCADDWTERHLAYGSLLQGMRGQSLGPSARSPVAGDTVMWSGEPGLPFVVTLVSGRNISLAEPGGAAAAAKKVRVEFVTVLDAPSLLAHEVPKIA